MADCSTALLPCHEPTAKYMAITIQKEKQMPLSRFARVPVGAFETAEIDNGTLVYGDSIPKANGVALTSTMI